MGIGKSPLAPLCQRGVIPPLGIFSLPKAGKGRVGGILPIDVITILRILIKHWIPVFTGMTDYYFTDWVTVRIL